MDSSGQSCGTRTRPCPAFLTPSSDSEPTPCQITWRSIGTSCRMDFPLLDSPKQILRDTQFSGRDDWSTLVPPGSSWRDMFTDLVHWSLELYIGTLFAARSQRRTPALWKTSSLGRSNVVDLIHVSLGSRQCLRCSHAVIILISCIYLTCNYIELFRFLMVDFDLKMSVTILQRDRIPRVFSTRIEIHWYV